MRARVRKHLGKLDRTCWLCGHFFYEKKWTSFLGVCVSHKSIKQDFFFPGEKRGRSEAQGSNFFFRVSLFLCNLIFYLSTFFSPICFCIFGPNLCFFSRGVLQYRFFSPASRYFFLLLLLLLLLLPQSHQSCRVMEILFLPPPSSSTKPTPRRKEEKAKFLLLKRERESWKERKKAGTFLLLLLCIYLLHLLVSQHHNRQ